MAIIDQAMLWRQFGAAIDMLRNALFLANEKVNVWPLKKSTLWVV